MVKACATYAARCLGDKGITYDLSEPEEGRAVDIDMVGSTDDISDIDLNDLKCLIEDDASPSRNNEAKNSSEDTSINDLVVPLGEYVLAYLKHGRNRKTLRFWLTAGGKVHGTLYPKVVTT